MSKKKTKPKPKEDEPMGGWLYGWKEISNFIGCSPRTAMDYKRRLNLPVATIPGPRGNEIMVAVPEKLNDWLQKLQKK